MLLVAPTFSLDQYAAKAVAYGIVMGNSLAELQTNADTMEAIYNSKIATSVNDSYPDKTIPKDYALHQNFPNPFNPTTVISYDLPVTGTVLLKVYDLLGREAATLVNQEQEPGRYSVPFDGSKYTSGIYFYKLQSGMYSQVKKMLLVK